MLLVQLIDCKLWDMVVSSGIPMEDPVTWRRAGAGGSHVSFPAPFRAGWEHQSGTQPDI